MTEIDFTKNNNPKIDKWLKTLFSATCLLYRAIHLIIFVRRGVNETVLAYRLQAMPAFFEGYALG